MKIISLMLCVFFIQCAIIDTGSRGIKKTFGEIKGEPLSEGLHFYNPITTTIYPYNIREEKFEGKTAIFTKDTQRTDVEFAVTWMPDEKMVHMIYKNIGNELQVEQKIIRPVVLGSIKDSIGQIIADDLVSKRELATDNAMALIQKNLAGRHIIIKDLQFTNIDFDANYEEAVEQKVVAIQKAQKAKNDTVRIEEEAKQKIKIAEAEAESMRIKSEALSHNRGLVEFEWVQKWDGKLPQYNFGNAVPMINLDSLKKQTSSE